MSKITLYALAAERGQDLAKLEDLDLPPDVVRDTLESLQGDLEAKTQNTIAFARHLEKVAESIKEAEADMAKRRKAIENRAVDLRQYILECMQKNGIQKIDCPWFSVSIAKNPAAVLVEDERQIPAEFFVTPAPQLDKKAVSEALKEGKDVPGAKLTQGYRLNVR